MSKSYEIAPLDCNKRAQELIRDHYPDLDNAGVTIEYLFVTADRGAALALHGAQALAIVRIVNLRDRAKGEKDAEISIDAEAYKHMSSEQKDALLDHELNHLIVQRDGCNEFKFDDLSRPKLKMRKHDYEFGWFTEIAIRHGMNSPEVFQAKMIYDKDGQAFFPMLMEGK